MVKADLSLAKDKKTMEVEAESIAYTVCQHYGIDTSDYSFGYIAAWGSGKEMTELKNSLETIRSTASEIISKIDEQMRGFDKDLAQKQEKSMPEPEKPDRSNIIGNTAYRDIADKEYFKVDSALTAAVVAGLEAKSVKFSGKISDNNKTVFTLNKADKAIFEVVLKAVKKSLNVENTAPAQSAPAPTAETPATTEPSKTEPKADNSDIIGNTAFKEISDKKYFKVDNLAAPKIQAGLEELGVKYSGRIGADTTTFTINKADTPLFQQAEQAANAHKIPPPQVQNTQSSPTPPKAEIPQKPPSNGIIGNTKYSDIAEKKYLKMDTDIALRVADELEKQGIKFSGRVSDDKTTLTVDNADLAKCRAIAKEVRTAPAPAVNPVKEPIAAEQPPENPNPDLIDLMKPTHSFSICQLKDIPENRAIRFEPYQAVEDAGIKLTSENYSLIYSELLTATAAQNPQLLENIFAKFNAEPPSSFGGHALSISDVIVVHNGDEVKAHYCDRAGFREIPDFVPPENSHEMEKPQYPPVYLESLRHAVQNDEKALFVESMNLNHECAAAIDKAIQEVAEYRGMPGAYSYDLPTALEEVTEKYGAERVNAVIAHTVNFHDFDGRLSNQNKDWAKTIDTPQVDYIRLNTHLALLDGFVNHVRKAHESEKSQDSYEHPPPPDEPTIADRVPPPTVAELQSAVSKGESISLMDLAKAVKNEQSTADTPKAKKSIKGRIEADKAEKSTAGKPAPTAQKSKGEAEL
jgi:hypothetical protein